MASLGFRVCRLSVSELSTEGTASGSSPDGEMWLTPSANEDAAGTPNGQMQVMLTHQAKGHAELWGTPTSAVSCSGMGPTGGKSHQHRLERDYLDAQAQSHAELWSTPRSSDVEKGGPNMAFGAGGTPLPAQAACQTGQPPSSNAEPTASRGQLNPDFVCWLMGYPAGWLNYADSATPSSPKSRRKSSVPSVTVN